MNWAGAGPRLGKAKAGAGLGDHHHLHADLPRQSPRALSLPPPPAGEACAGRRRAAPGGNILIGDADTKGLLDHGHVIDHRPPPGRRGVCMSDCCSLRIVTSGLIGDRGPSPLPQLDVVLALISITTEPWFSDTGRVCGRSPSRASHRWSLLPNTSFPTSLETSSDTARKLLGCPRCGSLHGALVPSRAPHWHLGCSAGNVPQPGHLHLVAGESGAVLQATSPRPPLRAGIDPASSWKSSS